MRTPLAILVLALGCFGCRDASNPPPLVDYHARMEQVCVSVSNGMSYAQVVAAIGQPYLADTNGHSVMALFRFTPPARYHEAMTNGVKVDFYDGLVVGKSPMQGSRP
jgi:hypothetical protein